MKSTIRKYAPPIFHCINDFGQGSLAALIPFFIANFNLNYYQSAAIIFCNTIVASIAQPVLGYVADRWRVPWFIPVGFAVTLVSISAIALATSYEMILALALMSGVGAALFHPEAALLVNRTQSHEIGNAMGRSLLVAFMSLAANSSGCLRLLPRSACCYIYMLSQVILLRPKIRVNVKAKLRVQIQA